LVLLLRDDIQETILSLVASVLSPLQIWPGEQPFLVLQLCVVIQCCLVLASRFVYLVLPLIVHEEDELRLHHLIHRVGLVHPPNLVLLMIGA
jgi:hypothetical protein